MFEPKFAKLQAQIDDLTEAVSALQRGVHLLAGETVSQFGDPPGSAPLGAVQVQSALDRVSEALEKVRGAA